MSSYLYSLWVIWAEIRCRNTNACAKRSVAGPVDGGEENRYQTYNVLEVYIVPILRRSRTGLPAAQRHCDDPAGTSTTPCRAYLEYLVFRVSSVNNNNSDLMKSK
jgi:hypothetical protein